MVKNELKAARENAKLSQRQMAEIMGIPRRTIEDWETGKSNPPEYVKRLVIKELKEIGEGGE